jgi:hypothetical protein
MRYPARPVLRIFLRAANEKRRHAARRRNIRPSISTKALGHFRRRFEEGFDLI